MHVFFGKSLARGFSLDLIGFPANLLRLSVETPAQRFDRASAAQNIWPVLTMGLLDVLMLEAETGMGGEEKDRALQAEDSQQHQTPLRDAPFSPGLREKGTIKQYSWYAHLIPLQVWPIVLTFLHLFKTRSIFSQN